MYCNAGGTQMCVKQLFAAVPATLLILGFGVANAGQTIKDLVAIACVNDKWDVKEPEKGHKLVDYAGRCVNIPDDAAAAKSTADCAGKYEYMPDGSWKGSGTCTYTYKIPVARANTKALVAVARTSLRNSPTRC
jgi:hypothetical protein